jgi:lipoprotein NlpI
MASSSRAKLRFFLLAGLLVIGLVGGAWWWFQRKPAPDMVAVLEANNRGVGLMESFKYEEAVEAFEEVVRLDPDWQPGRINLGIALLNTDTPENLKRAVAQFNDILKKDPDNPYAHFCLGIMLKYQREGVDAIKHFETVTRIDPNDAYAWCNLALLLSAEPERAIECYRKAAKLDPHMRSAVYGLALAMRGRDDDEAMRLMNESEELRNANWENVLDLKYTDMGKYAEVIGRRTDASAVKTGPVPLFEKRSLRIQLAEGARWARAADFGKGPVAELRAAVRARFGATVVVLDYNRDGKPDLFLAGAVVEKGEVRDLLLRNDGGGKFTDVTAEAGLANPHPTLGVAVGDFDNDGYPDLLLTGAGSQRLFRNTGKDGKFAFEDVTAKATLDQLTSVCLGAFFLDLDQDGDLDLLIAEFAPTPEEALKILKGEKAAGGGLAVYLNVGEAKAAVVLSDNQPPLECKWKRATNLPGLKDLKRPIVGFAASDLDGDRDLDLLVLTERAIPSVAINERLLRFRTKPLSENVAPGLSWNGALVLDVDHDGRSDLLLLAAREKPRLLLNRAGSGNEDVTKWFEAGTTISPPLRQAVAIDIDLDGWTDVVGLSDKGLPVLLHNEGGKLVHLRDAFGRDEDMSRDLIAATVFASHSAPAPKEGKERSCDGFLDLLVWSESEGLQLYGNRGNGNHGIQVELSGRIKAEPEGKSCRCNADGVGTRVTAQSGDLWSEVEYTTLSAGLGQSHQPLVLGLGRFSRVNVLRLRWPDAACQAELDLACHGLLPIVERNRKRSSCPILFTWDGQHFVFVTDFLGAGSVGEFSPDGSTRPPRPEESLKIEPGQLAPLNGHYVLRLAEPMDEITYLDRVQLVAVDHPAGVRVFPDERFDDPPPSQEMFAFRDAVFPVKATDHRGRDVTAKLKAWDRDTVDGFARRAWLGFAEEHFVELDFGDRLSGFKPDDRLFLCLAGWTDYAEPSSIWAAHQAGVEMLPPVLERLDADGRWQKVCDAGFPAGLPRTMTRELTGKLGGPSCKLRLRTNLQIYWDQAFIAAKCHTVRNTPPGASAKGEKQGVVRATTLEIGSATLEACGLMQEFSPDGKQPTIYDHDRSESAPVVRLAGKLTRYGDVTELLRDRDDRFVIFGPEDALTLKFDAKALPPLPEGWQRSFVLRIWGYCKDASPFTAENGTVEPLPFRAMKNYPPGQDEKYPSDPLHLDYLKRFNTREVKPDGVPATGRREPRRSLLRGS